MDPNSLKTMAAAASAGGGDKVYVEEVFSTHLYAGASGTNAINNGIDLDGEGGLVWCKKRDTDGYSHHMYDTERGVTKYLSSNSTAADATTGTDFSSFNSNGFTLGTPDSIGSGLNATGGDYVSWTFRKCPGFFDIVTYTGNATTRTIAHNLGCVPGCIIVKETSGTGNWFVYHLGMASGGDAANQRHLRLNLSNTSAGAVEWDDTDPTSTHFTIYSSNDVNENGSTYVAYLFAAGTDSGSQIFGEDGDESIIKCGVTSGQGLYDLGWEPQWILMKTHVPGAAGDWMIFDNMRGMAKPDAQSGSNAQRLRPNETDKEDTSGRVSFESNGFTERYWGSSYPLIYIAIRRGPMKTPEDATKVFEPSTFTVSQDTQRTTSFPIDLVMGADRGSSGQGFALEDRIRGFARENSANVSAKLKTAVQDAENTFQSPIVYDVTNNTLIDGGYFSGYSGIFYYFRRAPGFFDIVCYTGTGSARTVAHNLGVVPEMIITKSRPEASNDWHVYHESMGNGPAQYLNYNYAKTGSSTAYWNETSPTSSVFTVGTAPSNGNTYGYVAYLFASCPGVSKVGSYTSTGSDVTVDCGFSGGPRFILVKAIDRTDHWYAIDTARGLVSGNDYWIEVDDATAESDDDIFDPTSSGFTVHPNNFTNSDSGEEYLFLAIA